MALTPEGKIQNAICERLQERGVFFFRTNNQPVYDRHLNNGYGGYRNQGKWAAPGLPDIICIINGRFVSIEVKTPRGRQSADQMLFEKRCKTNGGIYILARSVADVDSALDDGIPML